MNLHLLIDYPSEIVFDDKDIVLIGNYQNSTINGKACVYNLDNSLGDEDIVFYRELNSFYTEYLSDYLSCSNSTYMKIFRTVNIILRNIEAILRNENIKEITLYGGCRRPYYVSSGGEGEGNRVSGYTTNLLVNGFIYDYYKNNYKINWIKKRNSTIVFLKNYVNNFFIRSNTFAHSLYSSIRDSVISCLYIETDKCAVIDLHLQFRHLSVLFPEKDNITFLTRDRELAKICIHEGWHACYMPSPNIINVLTIFLKYRGCLSIRLKRMCFGGYNFSYALNTIKISNELLQQQFRHYIKKYGNKDIHIITDMTFGNDIQSIQSVCTELGKTHVNYQGVSMAKMLFPCMDLADKFYMYSKKTCDLYHQIDQRYNFYFPIYTIKNKNVKGKNLTICIFLQPDAFANDYIHLMEILFPLISKKKDVVKKVIIKPHYRQNKIEQINRVCGEYEYVQVADNNDTCRDIILSSDIAVGICSSVIFESLQYGLPTIIYNPENRYSNLIYNNDICYPEVNKVVSSPAQIVGIIDLYIDFKDEFDNNLKKMQNDCLKISNIL